MVIHVFLHNTHIAWQRRRTIWIVLTRSYLKSLAQRDFWFQFSFLKSIVPRGGGAYFVLGGWGGGGNKQVLEMVTCRGSGGILCQKILKSWSLEMLLAAFSARYQKNKCGSTVKWQMFYFLFVTWYTYNLIHIWLSPALCIIILALVRTLNCFITSASRVQQEGECSKSLVLHEDAKFWQIGEWMRNCLRERAIVVSLFYSQAELWEY